MALRSKSLLFLCGIVLLVAKLRADDLAQDRIYQELVQRSFFSLPPTQDYRGFQCHQPQDCENWWRASVQFLFDYGEDLTQWQALALREQMTQLGLWQRSIEDEVDLYLLDRQFFYESRSLQEVLQREPAEWMRSAGVRARLCSYQSWLVEEEQILVNCATRIAQLTPPEAIEDLFLPLPTSFQQRSKLFSFCREDRRQVCYTILQQNNGQIFLDEQGQVWGMPMLALSRKRKPATQRDGHTPRGVQWIDGVMPSADQQRIFGKFRRLILQFLSDRELRQLLPTSHLSQDWWQQAQIARDVGRLYLRIHGTGLRNGNSRRDYYPFVATRGCVATREGRYPLLQAEEFQDQRILLNAMMQAQGLPPIFSNERKISSVYYLVEIPGQGAVTREEVLALLPPNLLANSLGNRGVKALREPAL